MKNLNFMKENYTRQYNTIKAELNQAKTKKDKITKIYKLAAQYNKDKANISTTAQYDAWVVKMNFLNETLQKLARV